MSVAFFTDRDLGLQFPAILRDAGLSVERHVDHFLPDCPDETWLSEVSAQGWIAVTHDARIRYKPNARAVVMAHKVLLLVVVGHACASSDSPGKTAKVISPDLGTGQRSTSSRQADTPPPRTEKLPPPTSKLPPRAS